MDREWARGAASINEKSNFGAGFGATERHTIRAAVDLFAAFAEIRTADQARVSINDAGEKELGM